MLQTHNRSIRCKGTFVKIYYSYIRRLTLSIILHGNHDSTTSENK